MNMICPVCQTEFKRNASRHKYCRLQCKNTAWKRRNPGYKNKYRKPLAVEAAGVEEWLNERWPR